MSRKTPISTASDLIDCLGGTAVVSRRFGVGMSAVSNWRTLGIPERLHYRFAKAADAAGLKLSRDFFPSEAA